MSMTVWTAKIRLKRISERRIASAPKITRETSGGTTSLSRARAGIFTLRIARR
jgi:hypothetical protein